MAVGLLQVSHIWQCPTNNKIFKCLTDQSVFLRERPQNLTNSIVVPTNHYVYLTKSSQKLIVCKFYNRSCTTCRHRTTVSCKLSWLQLCNQYLVASACQGSMGYNMPGQPSLVNDQTKIGNFPRAMWNLCFRICIGAEEMGLVWTEWQWAIHITLAYLVWCQDLGSWDEAMLHKPTMDWAQTQVHQLYT